MKQFIQTNGVVFARDLPEGLIIPKLEVGLYQFKADPIFGSCLTKSVKDLSIPTKVFGEHYEKRDRIFNTFMESSQSITALLHGYKGAGKSMLAALIAQKSLDNGIPVIELTSEFDPENSEHLDFIETLGTITIIWDEYFKALASKAPQQENTKDYDSHRNERYVNEHVNSIQQNMLNFFQSTSGTKRLTILLDNTRERLNDFFVNRPGRLYFVYEFNGIKAKEALEVAKYFNVSPQYFVDIINYTLRQTVSYDMLITLVKELVKNEGKPYSWIISPLNISTSKLLENFFDIAQVDSNWFNQFNVKPTHAWFVHKGIKIQFKVFNPFPADFDYKSLLLEFEDGAERINKKDYDIRFSELRVLVEMGKISELQSKWISEFGNDLTDVNTKTAIFDYTIYINAGLSETGEVQYTMELSNLPEYFVPKGTKVILPESVLDLI